VDLVGCGLSAVPPEIFSLADSLEILDLSRNQLTQLPAELPRLKRLRILFASENAFTELPAVLGQCPQLEMVGFKSNRITQVPEEALPQRLRWLILTDNALTQLPDSLGQRPRLQKLALAGNRLRQLPDSLAGSTALELLRIAANALDTLPGWLAELPRLSWLAHGGNPLSQSTEEAALRTPLPELPWPALQLQALLGQGASGHIHRVRHGEAELALKIFKGEVTSDGWPHTEQATWLQAGQHAALIPVRGRLSQHPQGSQGLAMPLVAAQFRPLAAPPSLASCSRDVYDPALRLAPSAALGLARSMSAVLLHLHQRGLMHGDFYAHNILHDGQGQALLGDFGAASFLPQSAAQALALQRVEVRALGCLLEELAALLPDGGPQRRLASLAQACLDERPGARPLLAEVHAQLAQPD
jgi:hypothetical protein